MNDSAEQNSRSHCNKHKAAKNEIAYLLSELCDAWLHAVHKVNRIFFGKPVR